MLNLVIIGASGFIGTNLLRKLNNKDINVIAVSLNMEDFPFFLDSNNIKYEDYKTFESRKDSLEGYIAINFAYTRSVIPEQIEDSKKFTYKVTEVIKNLNIKKYIYISTQSVYDEKRTEPAQETDEVKPASIYGEGKVDLETWLKDFSKLNNISLTILRLASVVGEGMEMRITSRFVDFALTKGEINVTDSGQSLSFIHVDDLIDVLIEFLEYLSNYENPNSGEIYNVGTEESYSLIDIANNVKEVLNEHNKDVNINVEKKDGEYKNNSLNMTKTFGILNWRPKYYLKDIIREEIKRKIKQ